MSSYYGAHLIYHPKWRPSSYWKGALWTVSPRQHVWTDPIPDKAEVFSYSPTWKPLHNLPLPAATNLTSSPAPSLANLSHYILLSWHILTVNFSPASRLFALADVFACNTYPSFSYPQKSLRTFPWFLLECLLAREAFMEISAESAFISHLMCFCSSIILHVFLHTVYQPLILSVDMFTIAFLVH